MRVLRYLTIEVRLSTIVNCLEQLGYLIVLNAIQTASFIFKNAILNETEEPLNIS